MGHGLPFSHHGKNHLTERLWNMSYRTLNSEEERTSIYDRRVVTQRNWIDARFTYRPEDSNHQGLEDR